MLANRCEMRMNITRQSTHHSNCCRKRVNELRKWVCDLFARILRSRENSPLSDRLQKFAPVANEERLHQGEIVCGLVQARQSLTTVGTAGDLSLDEIEHPFAIVMTQDCDLEQDARIRQGGSGASQLINVLFCETVTAAALKGKVPQGTEMWKRIIHNNDMRYQCLEAAPIEQDTAGKGLPALGCDFKKYFTVSVDEVYKRIAMGQIQRRCRLVTPYAEHLLSRFCNFQSRVPLPQNHEVPITPPE
jgi:hypothetical protein